ncbi:MAG: hypothetical protein HY898_20100 [Deltaproteobacteria bacterium]|nr:hypothetical protein [Deltaproteobacteria bacterium]
MSSVHWLARCTSCWCSLGLLAASTASCSDPVTPPPQAAFTATFGGASCAAAVDPGPKIGIGKADPGDWATYADGTEGIHVACRVVAQGDNYYANISISRGSTTLSFEATMPNDPTKTATTKTIRVGGPNTTGGTYAPDTDQTCTVAFIEGAPGRIKASYDCQTMVSGNTIANPPCHVSGYVVAENCDSE